MLKISEHIYVLEKNDDTDEPYLYYVSGKDSALEIDAGNSPYYYLKFIEELKALNLKKPSLIGITHWHWDHSFGLIASDIPSFAHPLTYHQLNKVAKWEWNDEAMKKRLANKEDIPFCDEHIRIQYPDLNNIKVKPIDFIIEEEKVLDLGDVHVRLLPMDSPHSRDTLLFVVEEDGIMIGGDASYEDYYDLNIAYDAERLKEFINFIEDYDFKYYAGGHAPLMSKEELLIELKGFLEAL